MIITKEVEKPEVWETPTWVKNFVVFICAVRPGSGQDWEQNLSRFEREKE